MVRRPRVIAAAGALAAALAAAAPILAPSAARAADDAGEAALRRVLRSGCRDGLAEVEAQARAADPAAPWASTVARLCGQILEQAATPTAAVGSAPSLVAAGGQGGDGSAAAPPAAPAGPAAVVSAPSPATAYDGRGLMVVGSTLYGIWLGIATDVLFTIDGPRSAIVPPLIGMAAGLGLSLVATGDHPLTNSQSWTIVTGLEYGSINGALWGGGFDLEAQGVVGTAVATGVTGGAIGVLVATERRPKAGDIEVVRSGLLWGTISGLLAVAALSPDAESKNIFRAAGAAMDLGFLAGVGLASSFDLSRNRVLIIDAGALGGGLAGLGLAWLVAGGPEANGQALAGAGLGGLYAGIALAAIFTRNMDRGGDLARAGDPAVPALYARDARGGWHWGTPGPVPVLAPPAAGMGSRAVGATLTMLGGSF